MRSREGYAHLRGQDRDTKTEAGDAYAPVPKVLVEMLTRPSRVLCVEDSDNFSKFPTSTTTMAEA